MPGLIAPAPQVTATSPPSRLRQALRSLDGAMEFHKRNIDETAWRASVELVVLPAI